MAVPVSSASAGSDIEPYRLHVSQRWLDLTNKKLELARIPRDPRGAKITDETVADLGVSKDELVTLLDYWQESYDHRAQEEEYNRRLPQYRTNLAVNNETDKTPNVHIPNVHFVHRKSSSDGAVPLLYCHDWGGSFVEVTRMIESLCEPVSTPTPSRSSDQAFHVVCPSIPGFGFSDASPDPKFGLDGAADVLDALMRKLGYDRYVLHGSRWGFLVCRAIALRHPSSCIAIHTAGLEVPRPTFQQAPLAWLSYHLARLTGARHPLLSFGYVPSDFEPTKPETYHPPSDALKIRSQTLDYALADSPTGLLALMLDIVRSGGPPCSYDTLTASGPSTRNSWSPADIVFWTMLYWLPGPEAPLRWLRNAAQESQPTSPLWRTFSPVALGVSQFRQGSPSAWASVYQELGWVRRHGRVVFRPAWEAPDELVVDLRAFVGEVVGGIYRAG